MQAIDHTAITSLGIPRLLLMDHAGLAIAGAVRQLLQSRRSRAASAAILICAGTGFNGGDGLSAARHLAGWGYAVRVALLGRIDKLREEPAVFARVLRALDIPLREVVSPGAVSRLQGWIDDSAVIVDALLGIGVRGEIREPIRRMIERINRSGRPVVSADVPSGLNADTGTPVPVAVRATVTVTFGCAKVGCLRGAGPVYAGTVLVNPITIPQRLLCS